MTTRGNINDLSYIIPAEGLVPDLKGSFIGELVGLASGAKKAAILEIRDENTFEAFVAHLKRLAPERKFHIIKVSPYKWQSDIIEHAFNIFIGRDKDELASLEKIWRDTPADFNEHNVRVAPFLSYPECCARIMHKTKDITDIFSLGKANQADFRVNNFYIRSASNALLTLHYSCSYDCRETFEYAEKVMKFLEKFPELSAFYKRVFKMPVMMVAHDKKIVRPIGDGVIFSFKGRFEDEKNLNYDKVYYMGDMSCTSYLNKEEGVEILKKILLGNRIRINKENIEILEGLKLKEKIKNDRLVFMNFS